MARFSRFNASRFPRYPDQGYIGGVCAGIAEFMGWNVRFIRLAAVVSVVLGCGSVIVVYLALWYIMEERRGEIGADGGHAYHDPAPSAPTGGSGGTYAGSGAYSRYGSSSADLKARFLRLEQRLSSMEECVVSNDYELRRELRKLES